MTIPTVYRRSFDDTRLNRHVKRYAATGTALSNLASYYETTGLLQKSLATLHTVADPIVPFWQERLYATLASLGECKKSQNRATI